MSKFVTALTFVLAVSAHASFADAGAKRAPVAAPPAAHKATKTKKIEPATAMNSANSQCKKYFALTGTVISVPC
jgi:hypothetical protein